MHAPYLASVHLIVAALLAVGVLSGCPVTKDEQACGVNLHADDVLCGNGQSDPGEMCLIMDLSLPIAKTMYRLHNLTLADFNGDKHIDLRIGSDIYAGNSDGTFSEVFVRPAGSSAAKDVASGDFNGDGITDLAYVSYDINVFNDPNLAPDRKSLSLWTGNAELDPLKTVTFSELFFEYPANVVAADFNEDGLDDLAIAQVASDVALCDAGILLRDTSLPVEQSFTRLGRVPGTNGSLGCRLATFDIDADGHWDLDTTLEDFYAGKGTGEFTPLRTERPIAVVATYGHDLNCDGVPDAVARSGDVTQIWQGLGKGNFKVIDPELSTGDVVATIEKLNNDAEPDILVAGELGLRLLVGDADFSFSEGVALSPHAGYTELAVADINADGQRDVVALGPSSVDIFVSHP